MRGGGGVLSYLPAVLAVRAAVLDRHVRPFCLGGPPVPPCSTLLRGHGRCHPHFLFCFLSLSRLRLVSVPGLHLGLVRGPGARSSESVFCFFLSLDRLELSGNERCDNRISRPCQQGSFPPKLQRKKRLGNHKTSKSSQEQAQYRAGSEGTAATKAWPIRAQMQLCTVIYAQVASTYPWELQSWPTAFGPWVGPRHLRQGLLTKAQRSCRPLRVGRSQGDTRGRGGSRDGPGRGATPGWRRCVRVHSL